VKTPSLRAGFQLLVLIGAVMPLAIVGVWLTNATSRAGQSLLRTQLDSAIEGIAQSVSVRWATREGELALLGNNDVVTRAMPSEPTPSARTAEYLSQVSQAMGPQITVVYLRPDGSVWWSTPIAGERSARSPGGSGDLRTVVVTRAIRDEHGARIGDLRASIRLSSLLNAAEARGVLPGAELETLTYGEPVSRAVPGRERVERLLAEPGLRLVLTAPLDPYVRPFGIAARTGLGVLVTVAVIALLLTGYVATRLTRSLERLAIAADAVAAGDLQREVEVSGSPEIVRLAQAFNAMTRSLRSTLSELSGQKALVAVGEFAASLSHEVRNSLTAIRVDLQHAKRHLDADHRATPLVGRTLETVTRLDSTVSGALRVARSGQATPISISLRHVLERAMRQAEPAFASAGGTLEALTLQPDVMIEGDAAALEQLFLNLLINAGQALLPGGRATVEIVDEDSRVVVAIADSGVGIRETELAAVGQSMHTTKADGTGLGLPIARRIAAVHRGEIRIDSAEGKGTQVRVTLPKRALTQTASETPRTAP
jgi:signal transduction histidine kinase